MTGRDGGDDGRLDDAEERIQTYLDELLLALRGRPREVRRLLAEVEAHLRELVDARCAAGLDRTAAAEDAVRRFGPPASVAGGLPSTAAYRTLLGQLTEAALLVVSLLLLAVGVAAVPTAVLAIAGDPRLATGDRPGPLPAPGRCQELIHALRVPDCSRALAADHIQDTVRNHLLGGVLGFVILVAWWLLHVQRQRRPVVLPAGFSLTVCGSLLAAVAVFLLATGVHNVALGTDGTSGLVGSGDLVTTGATVLAVALLCWVLLARRVTRQGRDPADPPPR